MGDSSAENGTVKPKSSNDEPADRHSVISVSSTESSVDPEHYEIASIASTLEERLTWRGRMQVVLHSHYFHIVIIVFVVLDALTVLFELLLDVGVFGNLKCRGEELLEEAEFCHYSSEYRYLCAAPSSSISIHNLTNTTLCTCKFREGQRVCDHYNTSEGLNPGEVLHGFSLAILCVFVIEIILKVIAFRLKFFTHKFEVFDAIVVLESFILDIASLEAEESFEAFGLLIILRLWRVVRVVNGAILSSKARSDAQLAEVRGEARKTIHILHKLQEHFVQENNEKDRLLELLASHNIDTTIKKRSKETESTEM